MPVTHGTARTSADRIHDQFCRCAACKPSLVPVHLHIAPVLPPAVMRPLEIVIGFAAVAVVVLMLSGAIH